MFAGEDLVGLEEGRGFFVFGVVFFGSLDCFFTWMAPMVLEIPNRVGNDTIGSDWCTSARGEDNLAIGGSDIRASLAMTSRVLRGRECRTSVYFYDCSCGVGGGI